MKSLSKAHCIRTLETDNNGTWDVWSGVTVRTREQNILHFYEVSPHKILWHFVREGEIKLMAAYGDSLWVTMVEYL